MGEMAAITQVAERNASVIASTPVTIAVFSKKSFPRSLVTPPLGTDYSNDGKFVLIQIPAALSSLSSVVIEKLATLRMCAPSEGEPLLISNPPGGY